MREILFRGKRRDNGEWVGGYYVKIPYYLGDKDVFIIIPSDAMLYPRSEVSRYEEVIPETVGQYIGCEDRNGRKVFEGDVLERTGAFGTIERIVIDHVDGGSSFWYTTILPSYYDDSNPIDDNEYGTAIQWFKVIGNIHDNPELLKGETYNEG